MHHNILTKTKYYNKTSKLVITLHLKIYFRQKKYLQIDWHINSNGLTLSFAKSKTNRHGANK